MQDPGHLNIVLCGELKFGAEIKETERKVKTTAEEKYDLSMVERALASKTIHCLESCQNLLNLLFRSSPREKFRSSPRKKRLGPPEQVPDA
ncbi:TBC1 domain family member 24 [Plakobranchus ocellatus]|uniref:TBC1 domain family member 24 n=1 Tax=Plakobranchus ocellatus TaxID=259542 RepID=A0AAV3XSF8_9GAST|nr:TBC1 domain family member 24 [Plakobranchus ocellatus]